MPAQSAAALPHHSLASPSNDPVPGDVEFPKALRLFTAISFREAEAAASAFLASSRLCEGCTRILAQLHERLGSTLFRDDDPRALAQAFAPGDRDACTVRLLAACIIVYGRERVAVPTVH